jgi:hypothetical protein
MKVVDKQIGMIQRIIEIDGASGVLVKFALLAGAGRKDLQMLYNEEICGKLLLTCNCYKLHTTNRHDGLSIVVSRHGCKVRVRVIPSRLWENFRNNMVCCDPQDIRLAESKAGMTLDQIKEIYSCVVGDGVLVDKMSQSALLNCILNDMKSVSQHYCKSWEEAGLILPIL